MTQSLRDQLMNLGFKPAAKPAAPKQSERRPAVNQGAGKSAGKSQPAERRQDGGRADHGGKSGPSRRPAGKAQGKPAGRAEIDLAKAYAIRAQREKDERIAAEAARQEAARLRREARAKLTAFLAGKTLNEKDAEIARHFEYGGKIKRVYVTAEQLKALNAGELGVLQEGGRYVLVSAAVLAEAEQIFAPAVALKVDPNAPAGEDPYADPKYQVPDDLVW